MKINSFGINLNEGLPLSQETLDKFYVSCFNDNAQKIKKWIKDDIIETPLLFGGQIGSGKSTLVTKIFSDKKFTPDIILHFDREGLNLDVGDFLSIILSGFIKKALELHLDLSFSKLPNEIFELKANDWDGIINILYPEIFSLELFEKNISMRRTISQKNKYIIDTISNIGDLLKSKQKSPLYIFASGIDKYATNSPAFFSLKNSITLLSNYKTIFEVNATHLFIPDITAPFSNNCEKILIPTMDMESIAEILNKRMGVYAKPIEKELGIIAKWSGGNPRQAIRILTHYQASRKNKSINKTEKIFSAIRRTTDDLFSYSSKPSLDLIKTINNDQQIENSLLNLPGDKDTAQRALYGNWIFIIQQSINGSSPAMINPLVKVFFDINSSEIIEPEQKFLAEYADASGMSSTGLEFNILKNDDSKKSAEQILQEYFSIGIEEPICLNISEILDNISAALLSKDRQDRIIVGFKDKKILNAACAYMFAKANSYEYQTFEHHKLLTKQNDITQQLEKITNLAIDIISLEFDEKLSDKQLDILDKYRDNFINYQMLWWIPLDDLKEYLPHWVQLRELFEIFILEDELLGSLSIEDIKADLKFYEDLVESKNTAEDSMVKNLKIVLDYLQKNRGHSNG